MGKISNFVKFQELVGGYCGYLQQNNRFLVVQQINPQINDELIRAEEISSAGVENG